VKIRSFGIVVVEDGFPPTLEGVPHFIAPSDKCDSQEVTVLVAAAIYVSAVCDKDILRPQINAAREFAYTTRGDRHYTPSPPLLVQRG
jgi:hypothetical protein